MNFIIQIYCISLYSERLFRIIMKFILFLNLNTKKSPSEKGPRIGGTTLVYSFLIQKNCTLRLITVINRAHLRAQSISDGELQGRFSFASLEIPTNHFLSRKDIQIILFIVNVFLYDMS